MKRFTDKHKWADPWFRELSPIAKHLWEFLLDHCDHAGVVSVDLKAATFHIGDMVKEKHLSELESRLQTLPNGKTLIRQYVFFQFGELRESCPPHRTVLKLIGIHGLVRDGLDYRYPNVTLPVNNSLPYACPNARAQEEEEDKEEDKEGGDARGGYHKDSRTVLHLLNESTGRHYRETDSNLTFISARLCEPGVNLDGIRMMICRQVKRWKDTAQAEFLRPETLFNKTKFDGYYAAKDLPVCGNGHAESKQLQETINVPTV